MTISSKYSQKLSMYRHYKADYEYLVNGEIQSKTDEFKNRIACGEKVNDLLPEICAIVYEAFKRSIDIQLNDRQILAAMVLYEGNVVEMRSGEGKTLVAMVVAYANHLEGKKVHIVTVNDYLSTAAVDWLERVYKYLGLGVGCISGNINGVYDKDIIYGSYIGFMYDSLLDNTLDKIKSYLNNLFLEFVKPFDLSNAPLFRVRFIRFVEESNDEPIHEFNYEIGIKSIICL